MTFYSAFLEACKTPLTWGYKISDENLKAVKDYGGFLDEIGEKNYHDEAKKFFGVIELYTCGAKQTAGLKTRIRKREKDLKIFDKFIDILKDNSGHFRQVKDGIMAKELLEATENLREVISDEDKYLYLTDASCNKIKLDQYLNDLVKKYNLKNTTAKIHNLKIHINQ